jgi:O-antigen ligase
MPNWPAEAALRPYRWTLPWVLAMIALWPLPGPAEAVAALGVVVLLGQRLFGRLRGQPWPLPAATSALLAGLFLAYWLPELLSAPDAADRSRALRESVADLRYLPLLWGLALAAQSAQGLRRLVAGIGLVVLLWSLDAALQAVSGTSPLFWSLDTLKQLAGGDALCPADQIQAGNRLGGVFGLCNPKLGLVLASLSPFALALAGERWGRNGWMLAALLVGLVVLLAGSRAAWLSYGLVLVVSGMGRLGGRRLLLFGLVLLGGACALYALSAPLRERVADTVQVVRADDGGLDAALSGRGRIWRAAACMVLEHPLNGVGVRGFRQAWPGCDPQPAQAPAWGSGEAYHAHQLLLEILSETGVLGLLCWLAGAGLAFRAWYRATPAQRQAAQAPMLALGVTVFPLNTHLAFYSTFWGGVLITLCGLYAAAVTGPEQDARAQGP